MYTKYFPKFCEKNPSQITHRTRESTEHTVQTRIGSFNVYNMDKTNWNICYPDANLTF